MKEKTYPRVYSENDFPQLTVEGALNSLYAANVSNRHVIIKAIKDKYGEKGLKVILEALKVLGAKAAANGLERLHGEGKFKDQELGKVDNVHVMTELMAPGRSAFRHRYHVIEVNPKLAIHILYDCPDVPVFKKLKCPKNICSIIDNVEKGMVEALNIKWKMKVTHSLYGGPDQEGDPICLWILEDASEE